MRVFGALKWIAVTVVLFWGQAAVAEPAVTGIRLAVESQRTRVVLDLSEAIDAKVFMLSGPDRLVIDLPKLSWDAPDSAKGGVGLVKGYRYGQPDGSTFRLVLDLTGPVRVASKFNLPPDSGYKNRFVIDLTAIDPGSRSLAENSLEGDPGLPQIPSPLPKPTGTLTIAIDPGHGGVDPGAIGVDGSEEKDVVLNVGLKLRDALKKHGYSVVMTRESDVYYPLKERVAMARADEADLFISLHADTNSETELRGASVYTLSETASDAAAAELAQQENNSDMIADVDLSSYDEEISSTLIEMSMRETMNRSGRFAKVLLPQLATVTPLIKNTHRFAGFRVLKAPDVPSVLVELGQLSNSDDEARLTDDKRQGQLAEAMAKAVDRYFSQGTQRADRGELH